MQGRLVEWNPINPLRFVASGSKLEYFDISTSSEGNRSAKVINVREIPQITSIQWYPHADFQDIMAYGCMNSVIGLVEWTDKLQVSGGRGNNVSSKDTIINPAAKIRKPVTGLSWNPMVANQLAASFEKQKGDFCGVVWDIHAGQEIVKL